MPLPEPPCTIAKSDLKPNWLLLPAIPIVVSAFASPTVNSCEGLVVPIPTFPEESIVTLVVSAVVKDKE